MGKKTILGPVTLRRNLQEIPEVEGCFLMDFRPEYHLGTFESNLNEPLYPPVVRNSAFQQEWVAHSVAVFGSVMPSAGVERDIDSGRAGVVLFPSRALTLKILSDSTVEPALVDEVTELFAERLHGMFGALAYRAAALGEPQVIIAKLGKFEPLVQGEILRRIPFDVYRGSEILDDLYREMRTLMGHKGINGAWGKVVVSGSDIRIAINPNLPEFMESDDTINILEQ